MTAPLREQSINNGSTTLNGAIDNSQTSITVTTGSVFPSTGNFRIKISNEIMLVTARSTNTLTVVRGYEGTSGASHGDLSTTTLILTADSHDRFGKDNHPLWGYASVPPLNKLVGTDGITILTSSDFTWQNQGGATVTDEAGSMVMRVDATSGTSFRHLLRSEPTPTMTWISAFRPHVQGINGNGCNCQLGVVLRQSSTGKFISFAMNRQGSAAMRFAVDYWTNDTTYAGTTAFLGGNEIFLGPVVWSKLVDNSGGNIVWSISDDGVQWIQVYSASRTVHMLTTGPDQYGIAVNNGGSSAANEALHRLLHSHTE